MRAVQLDFARSDFPAALVEIDSPKLPNERWVRVRVTRGGICGSDLHMFYPTTGSLPLLGAYVALPAELGHEIAGIVVEAGKEVAIATGTRVAIDPVIACEARGIDPPCEKCAAGAPSACLETTSKRGTPGFFLGYTSGLGGGWADEVVVHRSMIHPIPASVPEAGETLFEPLSIAIHGILRAPPARGEAILIVGAGIIGLAMVAAARALFPENELTVLAKHDHQAVAAEAVGAHRVVLVDESGGHLEELGRVAGTRVIGSGSDRLLAGGFPYVVEAVGTPAAVTETLRLVDARGTVLLLGIPGLVNVDLTPIWLKEVAVVGAIFHAADPAPHGGALVHSVDRALSILATGALPASRIVTHEFPLADWRAGVAAAYERGRSKAIKVVLRPND